MCIRDRYNVLRDGSIKTFNQNRLNQQLGLLQVERDKHIEIESRNIRACIKGDAQKPIRKKRSTE